MKKSIVKNYQHIILFASHQANKIFTFTMVAMGSFSFAQNNDSIQIISNQKSDIDVENIQQLPISMSNKLLGNYTSTEVYFSHQNNQFSRKQTAEETNRYGFKSEGFYNINDDLKVFGSIGLEKFLEKNLAFNLSDERTDEIEVLNPHYYFVPRAASWDNQQYHIKAGLIKNFNQLNVALMGELNSNKLARKLDPRPEITNRKLSGELQIGYTHQAHQLFVLGGYGQKTKEYSHYFSNNQLDNVGNPETYVRFNSGFGRVINNPFVKSSTEPGGYYTVTEYKKIGGGYQFAQNNTNILVNYHYQRDLEDLYNSPFKYDERLTYQYLSIGHHGQIQWQQNINDKKWRTTIKASEITSKNFDYKALGINYINKLRNLKFDVNVIDQQNDKINYYLGGYVNYNQNRYLDHLAYIDQQINSLNVGVYANKDIVKKEKSTVNLALGADYYTALKNNLDYKNTTGISTNRFIDEVVMHDFAYNDLDKFSTKLDARYLFQMKNKSQLVFYTQLNSIFALGNSEIYTDLNTKSTHFVKVGIQLNY